jgi:hypothetical protein
MEQEIRTVAQLFANELQKLATDIGSHEIKLMVELDNGRPRIHLTYSGRHTGYSTVVGASLGALIDEVKRRRNFNDKEVGALTAIGDSLVALPKPANDDEIQL